MKYQIANLKHSLLVALALFAFTACSESDEEDEEFTNWQERNEQYFEQKYQEHKLMTTERFILPSWSQPSSLKLEDIAHNNTVLIDVLVDSENTLEPEFSDSVSVHYSGRLMPTPSNPEGYEFDRSYMNSKDFDPEVDVPATFALSGSLVPGFATAIQHMHRGDMWRVTIPYNLGYGATAKDYIPAYSTLIFDIYLVDFWHKEKGDKSEILILN